MASFIGCDANQVTVYIGEYHPPDTVLQRGCTLPAILLDDEHMKMDSRSRHQG